MKLRILSSILIFISAYSPLSIIFLAGGMVSGEADYHERVVNWEMQNHCHPLSESGHATRLKNGNTDI